jgi:hypothetical protein
VTRPVRFGDFTLDADEITAIEVQCLVEPARELSTWKVLARTGPRTLVVLDTFTGYDADQAADEYALQVQRELDRHRAGSAAT